MEVVKESYSEATHVVFSERIDGLSKIEDRGVNLAIWQRSPLEIAEPLEELMASGFKQAQFVYTRDQPIEVIGAFLDETIDLRSESAVILWNDIVVLADKMLEICGDQQIGISLDLISHDNCTSFHTDRQNLRLLCTYVGDGTYWLENQNVRRDQLNRNDNESVVVDWQEVRQMRSHWVGLFKGETYRGGKDQAIVHRSPEVLGRKDADRLLLRIDTF